MESQTIRSYIKRRVRIAFAVAFVAWLSFPLSGAANHGRAQPVVFIVSGAIFVGVILYLTWFVRCPRCSANLGQTVAMPLAFSWGQRQMKYCPYCAVSLDEPVSHGPIIGSR
jgi:hypothetical protein